MKRLIAAALALVLTLSFAACAQRKVAAKTTPASGKEATAEPSPALPTQPAAEPVPTSSAKPAPNPTASPAPKTTLAISEIAEGTYTGILSGDSWANTKGTMFVTCPSAELTVTVQGGQVTLYCEARASADGEIGGAATPHSPEYTAIVSGSLPLAQSGDTVVSAEGEVSMLGESLSIYYNNGKFTRWEVKARSSGSTYFCTVSIAMANGIPIAEIAVDGNLSHQTATVPLRLAAQTPEPIRR